MDAPVVATECEFPEGDEIWVIGIIWVDERVADIPEFASTPKGSPSPPMVASRIVNVKPPPPPSSFMVLIIGEFPSGDADNVSASPVSGEGELSLGIDGSVGAGGLLGVGDVDVVGIVGVLAVSGCGTTRGIVG